MVSPARQYEENSSALNHVKQRILVELDYSEELPGVRRSSDSPIWIVMVQASWCCQHLYIRAYKNIY